MTQKIDPADEKRALALGAKPATVAKWRQRGMPPAWRLKLIEEDAKQRRTSPETFLVSECERSDRGAAA